MRLALLGSVLCMCAGVRGDWIVTGVPAADWAQCPFRRVVVVNVKEHVDAGERAAYTDRRILVADTKNVLRKCGVSRIVQISGAQDMSAPAYRSGKFVFHADSLRLDRQMLAGLVQKNADMAVVYTKLALSDLRTVITKEKEAPIFMKATIVNDGIVIGLLVFFLFALVTVPVLNALAGIQIPRFQARHVHTK